MGHQSRSDRNAAFSRLSSLCCWPLLKATSQANLLWFARQKTGPDSNRYSPGVKHDSHTFTFQFVSKQQCSILASCHETTDDNFYEWHVLKHLQVSAAYLLVW